MAAHEVLVDVTRLLGRFMNGRLPTGVDRVGLAYLAHYGHRAQAVVRWAGRGFVLPAADSARLFALLACPAGRLRRDAWPLLAKALSLGWPARGDAAGRFFFNTGHSGLEQPAYPAMLGRLQARPLFFVHDLIPLTHPEYCRPGERERHARRMDTVLDLAAGVVANSQATLDGLARYAQSQGKPMPPAAVAWLAPGLALPAPAPRPPSGQAQDRPFGQAQDRPYFVVLGTIEPRKNHLLLLQLWRRLVERLGGAAPGLVVVGQRGWECENALDLLERCETLRGFVAERPGCADAELSALLLGAQALLFPSFAEGFGLPLVEALALGVPVIASDLPAFREVAGDIPDYLDPLDGPGWSAAVEAYAQPGSPARAAQSRRLAGFKAPTWDEHFAVVDSLMERLDAAG